MSPLAFKEISEHTLILWIVRGRGEATSRTTIAVANIIPGKYFR